MTDVTILARRYMRCLLDDKLIAAICRRQKLALMAAFTATGQPRVYVVEEC